MNNARCDFTRLRLSHSMYFGSFFFYFDLIRFASYFWVHIILLGSDRRIRLIIKRSHSALISSHNDPFNCSSAISISNGLVEWIQLQVSSPAETNTVHSTESYRIWHAQIFHWSLLAIHCHTTGDIFICQYPK